ncbi:MAG: hypothetical protein ACU826_01445 [Gammaproteobacteria bacterium]
MEPASTSLFLRAAVPSDGKGLQAPTVQLDQILLQRENAEGVFDFEFARFSVRSVGTHHKSAVPAEKPRDPTVLTDFGIVEIAEHRFFGRLLHGEIVMRTLPKPVMFGVATDAGFASDETGRRSSAVRRGFLRWRRRKSGAPVLRFLGRDPENRRGADRKNGYQDDGRPPLMPSEAIHHRQHELLPLE